MGCGSRHWFTVSMGVRSPNCTRCAAPNPRWNEERDRPAYNDVVNPRQFKWVRLPCPVCGAVVLQLTEDGVALSVDSHRPGVARARGDHPVLRSERCTGSGPVRDE